MSSVPTIVWRHNADVTPPKKSQPVSTKPHGNQTHGYSRTPIHSSWKHMRQRCLNPKSDKYKWYGGRGITICARWNSFENFLTDMLPTWFEGATLERNDPNGNYEPSNCCWKTQAENAKNRRNIRFSPEEIVEIKRRYFKLGESQNSIAKSLGVNQGYLSNVISRDT